MYLKTERLVLRLPEKGDAAWIAREIANPKVHRWLTHPPRPYTLADAHEWLARVAGDPLVRLIAFKGRPVGMVSITDGDLGYWLEEAAWGQGFMTEAAHALVAFYYETRGGELLSGWLDGNAGSEGVLRKLGFADTGTRMEHSAYHGRDVLAHRVRLEGSEGLQAPRAHAKRG
ncbi:MAG: GNAT family N-acetyltransferase [Pseudomonadota bacterium]